MDPDRIRPGTGHPHPLRGKTNSDPGRLRRRAAPVCHSTWRQGNPYSRVVEALPTNRQIENAAIDHVLRLELPRVATPSIPGARNSGLWLEVRQVQAAEADPKRFHLVIVENVRQGDPAAFRVLDLSGERLASLLARKRERHYFEVPFPWGSTTLVGDPSPCRSIDPSLHRPPSASARCGQSGRLDGGQHRTTVSNAPRSDRRASDESRRGSVHRRLR